MMSRAIEKMKRIYLVIIIKNKNNGIIYFIVMHRAYDLYKIL